MKSVNFYNKQLKIFIALGLILIFSSVLRAAEPLQNSENHRLQSLVSNHHPAVYLMESEMKVYGDNPVVLYADAASVSLLAGRQEAFETVELITLKLTAAKDESAKINVSQLGAFANLKYILVQYEYDACGGGDACLDKKADAAVTLPADSEIEVLYKLSIPQ